MSFNNQNIEILKRAFPHLNGNKQRSINIILKLAELQDSVSQLSNVSSMETCENETKRTNVEELLKSIKPVCSKKEQDVIDFALNFNKTKDIYNTYKILNNDNSSIDTTFNLLKNNNSVLVKTCLLIFPLKVSLIS